MFCVVLCAVNVMVGDDDDVDDDGGENDADNDEDGDEMTRKRFPAHSTFIPRTSNSSNSKYGQNT